MTKQKELKTTHVSFEDFTDMEHKPYSSFYIRTSMDYVYIHTAHRAIAQEWADENYPPRRKYVVRAARQQQQKPRTEAGYSATGVASR